MILHFGIVDLLIASLWCFGFWKAFDAGMILERVDKWAAGSPMTLHYNAPVPGHLPAWLYKPLMGCVICMASIHGSAFFLVFIGLDWQLLLFVVCLSGLNFLLSQLVHD